MITEINLLRKQLSRTIVWVLFVLMASTQSSGASAKRVALVFGNSEYAIGALPHPMNDAEAIGATFRSLGFQSVTVVLNADKAQMEVALGKTARDSQDAEVAIVYFAGHGVERDGRNYVIPVDASLLRATDLDLQAVAVSVVLDQISQASKLKLFIVDASRPNSFPLSGNRRSTSRGLSRMEPDDNTLVFFSTKEGGVSVDSADKRHSNLTAALLRHLPTRGLEIRMMLARVRDDVLAASNRAQMPYVYGSLGRDRHYLAGVDLGTQQDYSKSASEPGTIEQTIADRERLETEIATALNARDKNHKQTQDKKDAYEKSMKKDPKIAFGPTATFDQCVLGCKNTTTKHARRMFPGAYSSESDKTYLDRNCRGACQRDVNHNWNY